MDNNIVKGKWNQVKGKVTEESGKLTGNKSQEIRGKAEQAGGKIQEKYGKIGIKVWIFKKLFFAKTPRELMEQLKKLEAEHPTEVSVMDEAAAAKRAEPSETENNKQGE